MAITVQYSHMVKLAQAKAIQQKVQIKQKMEYYNTALKTFSYKKKQTKN